MQAQLILRLCGVPEYLNLSGLDLGSAYNPGPASDSSWENNLEPKHCRQGKHTHCERGQTQCGRDIVSTRQCYLQCSCNLDSIFKSRDITLPTKVRLVKLMVFPVVMYGCESWTVNMAECRRIEAFELWCWRRLLRVPWTARRSN